VEEQATLTPKQTMSAQGVDIVALLHHQSILLRLVFVYFFVCFVLRCTLRSQGPLGQGGMLSKGGKPSSTRSSEKKVCIVWICGPGDIEFQSIYPFL
jgi:hypothetical protein